jgi:hypothetical protein
MRFGAGITVVGIGIVLLARKGEDVSEAVRTDERI